MSKAASKPRRYICKCRTFHTYPAYVHAYPTETIIHLCHCGEEHVIENLIPPPVTLRKPQRRRVQ
jgi:hypothetical protein